MTIFLRFEISQWYLVFWCKTQLYRPFLSIFNNDHLLSSKRMEKGLVPHGDIIVERPRLRPIFLSWGFKWEIYPFTPISDQDRISPYDINTISSRQVMRIKKNFSEGIISWSNTKILLTNITGTVWQTVRRISNEILGVKELKEDGSRSISMYSNSAITETE